MLALWDGQAQDVVTLTAALAGLLWVHVNILRPLAKAIKRLLSSIDAFEALPDTLADNDERMTAIEAELGRVLSRQKVMHNGQRAIIRELSLEDQVRRLAEEHDLELWASEPHRPARELEDGPSESA